MKNLDTNVWLPHIWFFLYTVAHSYSDHPNQLTKRKYYDFIQNIPLYIPHSDIQNRFCRILDSFPVTPYLDNKDSFTYWVHFVQNKLHGELGLEQQTYLQHLDNYYNAYLPMPIELSTKWGIQKKYICYGFVALCVLGILIFYTK